MALWKSDSFDVLLIHFPYHLIEFLLDSVNKLTIASIRPLLFISREMPNKRDGKMNVGWFQASRVAIHRAKNNIFYNKLIFR